LIGEPVGEVVRALVYDARDPCSAPLSGWFLRCKNIGSQSIQVLTLAI